MNQKSSLREDPQFVSWVLTGNILFKRRDEEQCKRGLVGKRDAPEMGANADDHERLFATSFHERRFWLRVWQALPVQGESWSICFFGAMEDEYRPAAKIP